MRILILHSRYRSALPSGENRVVDEEAALLAAAGHDVELHMPSSDEIEGYGRLDKALLPGRVVWSGRARHEVAGLVDRFRPDVVHVHNTFPLLSASVLGAVRRAGVPIVATVHNYRHLCAGGGLFRDGHVCYDCIGTRGLRGLRLGCYRGSVAATAPIWAANLLTGRLWHRDVAFLLCPSEGQRQIFLRAGFDPAKVVTKPNFVVDQPERRDPSRHLLYLGRLGLEKGVDVLMAAWDRLGTTAPLPLVIAGGGPLEGDVRAWAEGRDDVRYLGQQDRAGCAALVRDAAAVIAPSVVEETFGLVIVEAMAAGVPAVASAIGSFPSLIRAGIDGLLVPVGDVAALAAALVQVGSDAELSRRLGRMGREAYVERFSPEANLAALEGIYGRATRQSREGRA
jgi:glycosyltransferase involved in cell wall biosynthesis